jgi:radical SAM enzyme (TIGR01210 family)
LSIEPLDRWVLERRRPKAPLDPERAYASLWEEEPDAAGALIPTATVFLTNRECPFRCVMCDLWVNTLDAAVPPGAIPRQIQRALAALRPARHLKLYNAGSFFDPRAVPAEDDEAIARAAACFDRVIVEAHPAFLAGRFGERCLRFRDRLHGRLEVAVGLETAHPEVLRRLNKQMTLDAFRAAAAFLSRHDIALRVFVLLNPPFIQGNAAVEWACRSIDEAAACGADVCSIIPTRSGNGAIEALGRDFVPPRLTALEAVLEYGLGASAVTRDERRSRMRVFADLWDIERFFDCGCSRLRAARLAAMNRCQRVLERVECDCDARC